MLVLSEWDPVPRFSSFCIKDTNRRRKDQSCEDLIKTKVN